MSTIFSVAQARANLGRLLPTLDRIVELRADLSELSAALGGGERTTRLGGLPELKARQASLDELLSTVAGAGVEIKSLAPLLLDYPAQLDGEPVLLCWLEGEQRLDWYHRLDLGFAGRRRLPS